MPNPESILKNLADRLKELRLDARRLPKEKQAAVDELWTDIYQNIVSVRQAADKRVALQRVYGKLGKLVRVARKHGVGEQHIARLSTVTQTFREALEAAYPPDPPPPPQPRKCTFHLKTSNSH